MVDDPRTSRQPVSEVLVVALGNANSTQTVLELSDEQMFVLTEYVVTYSDAATTGPIRVEVQDTDSGDAVGDTNQGDAVVLEELATGDRISESSLARREFGNDVVAITDRGTVGQDDDVILTVGGYYVSS